MITPTDTAALSDIFPFSQRNNKDNKGTGQIINNEIAKDCKLEYFFFILRNSLDSSKLIFFIVLSSFKSISSIRSISSFNKVSVEVAIRFSTIKVFTYQQFVEMLKRLISAW